ncbi:amino acid adenylation domain-containing protein [Micromonospora sp. NPDC005298]|uniref:amino acid adenylation domain-containing protein n=1 Tax=Micromonospora sp. NPDC005298 TaxID=3156873 RepID=UPI0033B0E060
MVDAPELPPPDWFATDRPFVPRTVPDLLAAGAAAHGGRPALVTADGIAYRHDELAAASATTAGFLHSVGVGPGTAVGLLCDHHPEAVRSVIGVLRAGGVYVPVDVRWPAERIAVALHQMNCRSLLVDRSTARTAYELLDRVPSLTSIVCVDGDLDAFDDPDRLTMMVGLWNSIAADPDEYRGAGFNLRPNSVTFTEAEILAYRDHVVDLVAAAGDGCRVLEIGCGNGLIGKALMAAGFDYVGVDPSPVAVAGLTAWAAEHDVKATVRTGYAHELGPDDEPFDVVLVASTAQFFPGPRYLATVVGECRRVLRDTGRLVIADVIDPISGDNPDLFRIPVRAWEFLAADGFAGAEIVRRSDDRLPGLLQRRYDVVLAAGGSDRPADRLVLAGRPQVDASTPWSGSGPATRDMAYCIFTSGSTGQPKGVLVTHHAVANLIDWVNREFGVDASDRLLFVTSFAFDLSIYDMFGVLSAGGSVHLLPDAVLAQPERVYDVLTSEDITFWDSAPAALSVVLTATRGRPPGGRPALRRVFLSGDWVPVSMPAEIRDRFGADTTVVALGGATEATVWSNAFVAGEVDPRWPSIPYGKPMQNARYHVLDERWDPCPVGAPGDLYIGGECLATAYAGDPELTATKFIPDPSPDRPGQRLYRTGDRARWLADGNLEFLGRLDDQVKIRGYRIELGEVQAALVRQPGVLDAAVVTAVIAGDRALCAFYVAGADPVDETRLRSGLGRTLPSYMMPTRLTALPALPVTANGKVDRAALAGLAAGPPATTPDTPRQDRPAPVTGEPDGVEQVVRAAWVEVLGPGAESGGDFFLAGGDSLTAARFVALVNEDAGTALKVRDVFDLLTLDALVTRARATEEAPQ